MRLWGIEFDCRSSQKEIGCSVRKTDPLDLVCCRTGRGGGRGIPVRDIEWRRPRRYSLVTGGMDEKEGCRLFLSRMSSFGMSRRRSGFQTEKSQIRDIEPSPAPISVTFPFQMVSKASKFKSFSRTVRALRLVTARLRSGAKYRQTCRWCIQDAHPLLRPQRRAANLP